MAKKKTEHYVDNKKFLEAMKEYRKLCNKAKREKRNKAILRNKYKILKEKEQDK